MVLPAGQFASIVKASDRKYHYLFLSIAFFSLGFLTATIIKNNSLTKTLAQSETVGNNIGQKAPDFNLSSFTGTTVSLTGLQGKPTVITFWASTCLTCLENLKTIENSKQEFQDSANFVGIHRSDMESAKRASFIITQKFSISYPLLIDSTSTYNQYNFTEDTGLTYFIDKNGLVSERLAGFVNEDVIKSKIRQLQQQ